MADVAGQIDVKTQAAGETPTSSPPPAPTQEQLDSAAPEAAAVTAPEARPEGTPEEKKSDDFPKKLAILTRREKAITQREQALKAVEPEFKEFQKAKRGELPPLERLKLVGLTYEQLTDAVLAAGAENTPENKIKALEEKLEKALKGDEEKQKKADEDAKKAQHEANVKVVETFKKGIGEFVEKNAATYELTATLDREEAAQLIYDVIDDYAAKNRDPKTGREPLLPLEKAAAAVEQFLEKRAEKLTSTNKIKSKLSPQASSGEQEESPKPDTKPVPQQSHTLTRQAVPASNKPDISRLSDRERLKRAAAKLQFTE